MTQEHSSELLLTESGIQHRVPRRTVSKHTALQWPESQEVGSGYLTYLAPDCSGPPAPLRPVAGFPGLRLLRGLRRPGARAR